MYSKKLSLIFAGVFVIGLLININTGSRNFIDVMNLEALAQTSGSSGSSGSSGDCEGDRRGCPIWSITYEVISGQLVTHCKSGGTLYCNI